MTIPAFLIEAGGKTFLCLVEDDGGGSLRVAMWASAANDGNPLHGEFVRALAVGGLRASGEPATDGPVPIGVVYRATPDSVDDGDIVDLLGDEKGRVVVVGSLGENILASGNLVPVAGRYDAVDRTLADGRVGALATDAAGRLVTVPKMATDSTPLVATVVGTSSSVVLEANTNRVSAKFTNNSDEIIFLAEGVAAQVDMGIRLNPNGGFYEIGLTNPFDGNVNGICVSGGKSLCVMETYKG